MMNQYEIMAEIAEQGSQFFTHEIVIVLPVSVPCELIFLVRYTGGGVIVQCYGNHATSAFDQQSRVAAFVEMIRHISHSGLPVRIQPHFQSILMGLIDWLGRGYAASRKAEAQGFGFQGFTVYLRFHYSNLNSYPSSFRKSMARGSAYCRFPLFQDFSESWKVMIDPLRAYLITLASTWGGRSFLL